MTSPVLLLLAFFTTIYIITADPICKPNGYDPSQVSCRSGADDYVLKRWLVSDNKQAAKISLRGCRIIDVEYESFYGTPSLSDIDLADNKLTTLKLGVLDGVSNLFRINLSNNSLTDLPLGLFDQNPNLNTIDLKGNNLVGLRTGILDPLLNLRYLDLSGNSILGRNLDSYLFERSRVIKFMDFSHNDMSDASDDLLRAFQEIEFLNLDGCSLTDVPAFATRENLRSMSRLFLSTNQISNIDIPTAFSNLENLEELNIARNILSSLHEDVFKPMRKLKVIILCYNQLKHLPETLFQNMPALNHIDLSYNLIMYVPVNAFRGAPLKSLNLSNNRFTYLTDNFCLELKNSGAQLKKFFFNQNPWQCKCLLDILKETHQLRINYNNMKYDGAHPVCVSEDFVCKRHDNFNDVYVDLYNNLVMKS